MISLEGPKFPNITLFLLFYYVSEFLLGVLNYWIFMRREVDLLGQEVLDAHMAFTIIGGSLFFLTSPLIFWPYKYGAQMPPRNRRNFTFITILVIFAFHDFPIWIIELSVALRYSVNSVVQGVSLVILSICTFWGFLTIWLGYAWKMAKYMQIKFDTSMNITHRSLAFGGNMGQEFSLGLREKPSTRLPPARI
eukprot:Tbor_TRINITY_DN5988_c1_g1::TRINITY_DN5988_c1_g1_i1::g.19349::m.19349